MNRVLFGVMFLLASVLNTAAAEKTLRIVCSFLPAYSLAATVAGDRATVQNLLPGNVNLHDYQLTPGDLARITAADLIIINGLGMETFLDRALQNSGPNTRNKIVTMTDGLRNQLIRQDSQQQHHEEAGHHHEYDPHVWLDPLLAAHCVTNILHALQKADPGNAPAYAQNAASLVKSLHALDEELRNQLTPVATMPFITYHRAFSYFVRRYGLNLAGVVETVPEIPPSPRERTALHKTIREKKVKALFAEPSGSTRLAREIVKDTGIRMEILDPLETGELKADSYIAGMRRNAASLLKGVR